MEIAVLEGRAIGRSCVYVTGLERLRVAVEICSILEGETGRDETEGKESNRIVKVMLRQTNSRKDP
jgi:hypothetical protein